MLCHALPIQSREPCQRDRPRRSAPEHAFFLEYVSCFLSPQASSCPISINEPGIIRRYILLSLCHYALVRMASTTSVIVDPMISGCGAKGFSIFSFLLFFGDKRIAIVSKRPMGN